MPPLRFFRSQLAHRAAPAVTYYIRGTSTNVGGTETFTIQFILDGQLTPEPAEIITCAVDGNGNWDYQYNGKKIYSLSSFAANNSTIITADFTDADDLESMIHMSGSGYLSAAFYNTTALKKVDFSGKLLSNVQDAACLFVSSAIEEIVMPNATFANCITIEQFANACGLLKKCDLSSAILGNCTIINNAFLSCTQLTDLKLQSATFASVINGAKAFGGCTSLTSVNLSSATFAVLTNANSMFSDCTSLTSVNLSAATLSSLDSANSMFKNCTTLTTITWSNSLNFANLRLMSSGWQSGMFSNCQSLTDASVPFSNQTFAKVTNMAYAFYACKALTTIDMHSATFDLVNNLDSCFSGCTNLSTIDVSNAIFGGSAPNPVSMFNGCTSLTNVDLTSATFGNSTTYAAMFSGCTALKSVDLSSCTFASATSTQSMFKNCTSLEDISWSQNISFDNLQLISNGWQSGMFTNCQKLKDASIAFLATQTLPKVTKLGYLFYNCKALTTIDMHSAVLGLAADTDAVFIGCSSLLHVDLSAATLTSVTYASDFFNGCSNLIDIKLDSCLFDKVSTISSGTFSNCNALTTIDVSQNSTAILPTSTNATMDMHWSPLAYTSMLKVANWLSDLTGYTAHTCTFKATAWNALTTAEQSNIDTILSGKNWTRAIA